MVCINNSNIEDLIFVDLCLVINIYAKVYILYIPRCVYRYNFGINGDTFLFSSSSSSSSSSSDYHLQFTRLIS